MCVWGLGCVSEYVDGNHWEGEGSYVGENSACGDLNCLQGMSGTLNHSPSMDLRSEGLGSRLEGSGGPHSVLQPTGGGPHQQHSPLQHFVQVTC